MRGRKNEIFIVSLDPVLIADIHKRIRSDERIKHYRIKRAAGQGPRREG